MLKRPRQLMRSPQMNKTWMSRASWVSTPACLSQPFSGFLTHVRGKGETARHWAFHFINLDFFGLHEGKKCDSFFFDFLSYKPNLYLATEGNSGSSAHQCKIHWCWKTGETRSKEENIQFNLKKKPQWWGRPRPRGWDHLCVLAACQISLAL